MFRQLFILSALIGLAFCAPADKIDGKLHNVLSNNGRVNVVVSFKEKTEQVLEQFKNERFQTRGNKISAIKTQLEKLQAKSQENAISVLQSHSASFKSLWINNKIYIKGANLEVVKALATLPEVDELREEFTYRIDDPVVESNYSINAEWGINKIEAEQAWALPGGNNGNGVVIGIIDTGVRWTHEALRNNFRTPYGWLDPYDNGPEPIDLNGHGTHVMGTIVGSGGIGVAPGAQWVACRGCGTSSCSEYALSTCGQFMFCPTLPNGQSPNCDMAPTLVSNSWAGGQGDSGYDTIVNTWHSAGIIPVFGQGNSGPDCATANSPADSPIVIGVGATTINDELAYFSSRGPSFRNGIIKPDISAPGFEIRSAWIDSDSAYRVASGTSMATPHLSGVVALLRARNPNLTYEQIKNLIQDNADRDLGAVQTCGNTPPNVFPNNMYGHGRVNARRALASAINGF